MSEQGRLRRFLHLERARPAAASEPPRERPDATGERFAGVERPSPSAADPRLARPQTGADLDRFAPDPEPRLELVDAEGRRPFIRCRRCGTDNNVFATACTGCALSLDTPEQLEFDERFWAARAVEAEREARAAAERAEIRARAEAEDARVRRAAAESLAREVGDAERRRLRAWGGWRTRRSGPWNPLGLRLIRRIRDPRWHLPVLALSSGLAGCLAAYGVHAKSLFLFLVGAAALALLLLDAPE